MSWNIEEIIIDIVFVNLISFTFNFNF